MSGAISLWYPDPGGTMNLSAPTGPAPGWECRRGVHCLCYLLARHLPGIQGAVALLLAETEQG